jgi:myo-inositol-1(or 4)-monophosphatase
MSATELKALLATAVAAARGAGGLMRTHLARVKRVHSATRHDIKLALDVRCQKLIERRLRRDWPDIAVLGEEGVLGNADAPLRWVVDPIDGTVNFTYGIPHACVSIALQRRVSSSEFRVSSSSKRSGFPRLTSHFSQFETVLGVVYDPFMDELFTAVRGGAARLNGRVIRVSARRDLGECILSMGFAKSTSTVRRGLPFFNRVIHRVRKIRMMGAAALGVCYVACGRFDSYLESGIKLWDIAAGGFIVERAGGEFWRQPIAGEHSFEMVASNATVGRRLRAMEK